MRLGNQKAFSKAYSIARGIALGALSRFAVFAGKLLRVQMRRPRLSLLSSSSASASSSAGFMVAATLAMAVAVGATLAMTLTMANSAGKSMRAVNNRMEMTSNMTTLTSSLSRDGRLSGNNIFYAPPASSAGYNDGGGRIPEGYNMSRAPSGAEIKYCVWYNGKNRTTIPAVGNPGADSAVIYINDNATSNLEVANAPAYALIDGGKNLSVQTSCSDLVTTDASGITVFKPASEISSGDDVVASMVNQQNAIDRQGQTMSNLLRGSNPDCDWRTHKTVFATDANGQITPQCVPEQDPVITASNEGGGAGNIWIDKVFSPSLSDPDSRLRLRTLSGGTGITVQTVGDQVVIASNAAGVTMRNLGDGQEIYKQGSSNPFDFRTLKPGNNVTIAPSADGDSLVINAIQPTTQGFINTGQNVGVGPGQIYAGTNNSSILFRRIRSADNNLEITTTGDDVTIRNTMIPGVAGAINTGGLDAGAADTATIKGLSQGIDANRNLQFRRIEAGSGVVFDDGTTATDGKKSLRISTDVAAAGGVTNGANIGTVGANIFERKDGSVLEFRKLAGVAST